MKVNSQIFAAAILTLLFIPNILFAADLSGDYLCNGNDPYAKKAYSGSLKINKTGETYDFKWNFSSAGLGVIIGTGFVAKNTSDVLSAVFSDSTDVKSVGVISYEIMPDGTLDGSWAIPGQTLLGSEVCKIVKVEKGSKPT